MNTEKDKKFFSLDSGLELEKALEETVKGWDDPKILCEIGEEYIKESEEITRKEFNSWQKSIYVWVR